MNIKDIISKMSMEEKFSLLIGKNNWQTVDIERLGIPSIIVSDGPHGLRKVSFDDNGKFKILIGASSRDIRLVGSVNI